MKTKHYLLILLILALSISAVSAHENRTSETVLDAADSDTLEKTYYYDEYGDEYEDDTVITHNVVKYYSDKDTKFKVKVYDDDYNPAEDVYVSFSVDYGKAREKTTDSNGNVYFALNMKPGKYTVETYIESENGKAYWSAENTVKIKSTIPVKELVKYSGSKKKFKIKFLDTKGKALAGEYVKVKINGKTFKLKTDKTGHVKIKSKFKIGKHKIYAYNPKSGEKRKINVVILKRGVHKVSVRIDGPTGYFPSKKLKNGDRIYTMYETKYRQYSPGVYVEARLSGLEDPQHTKLIKAKFYFKNKQTGKIITKTSNKVKYDTIKVKPIKGYSPYKAKVWYRDV